MIAKAKAISHGINDLRYITGESQHKKHPEKIYRVVDNLLPSQPDAMGIWNSMQLTLSQYRPIKNSVIRIELSPSPEHTQFYDIEDWQTLWQEFAEEFDRQVITGKNGKVRSDQFGGQQILSLVAYGIQRRSPSPPCCDLPFG